MRKLLTTVAAVLALGAPLSNASAQEMDEGSAPQSFDSGRAAKHLVDGASSLSFAFPNGGNAYAAGTAGYWMMFGDMNVGFNVGLAFDVTDTGAENTTSFDILLAPAIRYYISKSGSVAPFYFGQLNLRVFDSGVDGASDDPELGLAGGLGVEWFPADNFSISGQVGLGLDILRQAPGEPIALGTFTSALTAQLYF